jgi:hypothetical protein
LPEFQCEIVPTAIYNAPASVASRQKSGLEVKLLLCTISFCIFQRATGVLKLLPRNVHCPD